MYHISVLILCFLSASAFGSSTFSKTALDDTTSRLDSKAAATNTISTITTNNNTTTFTSTNSTMKSDSLPDDYGSCNMNWECERLSTHLNVCENNTCYSCHECCSNKEEDCPREKCLCNWFLTDAELKLVAQAILGIAVFVTCVALSSLMWKICARRLRRRHAVSSVDLLDDTTSLSSQQVFVVERLRDRPPCYEEAARDFTVEKPPPYSEAVVEEAESPARAVVVDSVPVMLTGTDLMARNFIAPPPYSLSPTRATSALVSPSLPITPPIQRLRRCVHKVVVIGRLKSSSTEHVSRGPRRVSCRQCECVSTAAVCSARAAREGSGPTEAASASESLASEIGSSQTETGTRSKAVPQSDGAERACSCGPTSTSE